MIPLWRGVSIYYKLEKNKIDLTIKQSWSKKNSGEE